MNINIPFRQTLIILHLVVLFNACDNKPDPIEETYINNNGLLVKKEYHKNGKLKSEQLFTLDTIKQGEHIKFYDNGNIELKNYFIKGVKNNNEEAFYQNGNKKYIGYYKDGKQDSLWTWYSIENKIESKGYWQNDKAFKEHFKYYADGVHLKEYLYYDLNGELIFKCSYSNDGILLKQEGNPIPMIIADNYSLSAGETFVGKIYVATPPHFKSIKVMSIIVGVTDDMKLLNKEKDYYLISEKVNRKGKYEWRITTWFYVESNAKPVEEKRSVFIETY